MPEARQKVTGWVVVKAVDPASRRIGGHFSTRYTDREGKEFAPEFFAKSIAPGGNYYNNPVLLYNHDASRLIGKADVATLGLDEVGAYGEFLVSDDDAWGQIERGELRGFSWFGFINPSASQIRVEGGRQIPVHYDGDLVEVTCTPIPCNPSALFAVKSLALQVGKAGTGDFPAGQAEEANRNETAMKTGDKAATGAQKAVYLGTYAESDMAIAALNELQWRLMWKVGDVLEATATPPAERLQMVRDMFEEFASLGLRTIEAIMGGQASEDATAAVKQIRALWPAGKPQAAAGAPAGDAVQAEKSAPDTLGAGTGET